MDLMSDVVILGGGLAGLSLALQLKRAVPEIQVTVLEKATFPVPEAAHKVGESTVELASHYFGQVLGLRDHLKESQLPKLGLRFFFGQGDIEDRLEVGGSEFPPAPSYQLDRGRFENFLAERCRQCGVTVIDGARVDEIAISEDGGPHEVRYRRQSGAAHGSTGAAHGTMGAAYGTMGAAPGSVGAAPTTHTLSVPRLVDASGRASFLKRKLGLRKAADHKASAVWFRVDKEIRIDEWSTDSSWRRGHEGRLARWYSTNHLMGPGYWVWLIPLSSGSTSVGIVVDEGMHPVAGLSSVEKARAWMEKHEPQCATKVFAGGVAVQDFLALKNFTHDCERVYSAKRWYLTGEAGVFLDPFYSPGSDFIAISNTFVARLIEADFKGEDVRSRTRYYNNLFLSFKTRTMEIYQDQYPIFGHPQVMPAKIVWDFATYWVLLAYLFFQDRLWEPGDLTSAADEVTRIGKVNSFMQTFFRQTASVLEPRRVTERIDFLRIKFLADINGALVGSKEDGDFVNTLRANADRLERFASEMVAALSGEPEERYEESEPSDELGEFFAKLGVGLEAVKA